MNSLETLIIKYNKSNKKDNDKLILLDDVDLAALLWSLNNGQFELMGFGNKSFMRYFMTGNEDNLFNFTLDCLDMVQQNGADNLKNKFINGHV